MEQCSHSAWIRSACSRPRSADNSPPFQNVLPRRCIGIDFRMACQPRWKITYTKRQFRSGGLFVVPRFQKSGVRGFGSATTRLNRPTVLFLPQLPSRAPDSETSGNYKRSLWIPQNVHPFNSSSMSSPRPNLHRPTQFAPSVPHTFCYLTVGPVETLTLEDPDR